MLKKNDKNGNAKGANPNAKDIDALLQSRADAFERGQGTVGGGQAPAKRFFEPAAQNDVPIAALAGGKKQAPMVLDHQVLMTRDLQIQMDECVEAMRRGVVPKRTEEGTGGTYFLYLENGDVGKRKPVAMFKPKDEEVYAPCNPRGWPGAEDSEGVRPGVYSTHQACREAAAFFLDHHGFSSVPETGMVYSINTAYSNHPNAAPHWKHGSFQKFVDAADSVGDYGTSKFSLHDVHKIGILDIRIINMDRNDGNILVQKEKERVRDRETGEVVEKKVYRLRPIDHGLSLPDRLEIIEDDLVWMCWPQAKVKFSPETKQWILKLK